MGILRYQMIFICVFGMISPFCSVNTVSYMDWVLKIIELYYSIHLMNTFGNFCLELLHPCVIWQTAV